MEIPATNVTPIERTIESQQVILDGHSRGIETLFNQQLELLERLRVQHDCLRSQQDLLAELADSFRMLASQATLTSSQALSPPTPAPSPVPLITREPKLMLPLRYEGEAGKCRNVIAQCEIFFRAQPSRFSTEDSRVSFILSLLTGTALAWVGPLIRANSPIVSTTGMLTQEMISVFDHDVTGHDAGTRLMRLRQGKGSVADFSIKFRSLASETGWPEAPIMTMFIQALSGPVRDALATLDPPATLDALVRTAIRIDNRVQESYGKDLGGRTLPDGPLGLPGSLAESAPPLDTACSEPMQIDGSFVSQTRHNKRRRPIICFHCEKPGHIRPQCPNLKGKRDGPLAKKKGLEGSIQRYIQSSLRTFISVFLVWNQNKIKAKAYLDSGAVDCFIDSQWAKGLHMPIRSLPQARPIAALDGRPLGVGLVSEMTDFISMSVDSHSEKMRFSLVDSPTYPIVLGHSWLVRHQPRIRWGEGEQPIIQWGTECYGRCCPALLSGSSPHWETDGDADSNDEEAIVTPTENDINEESLTGDIQYDWDVPMDDCPGSKNAKPDALSRIRDRTDRNSRPEPVVPSAQIVAPVLWGVEALVQRALRQDPGPGGGPPHCLFVPPSMR